MSITHSWNGTVLTITSDSGTSSADLKGDTGCRGPQGPAGVVYGDTSDIVLDGYATEQYVDDKLAALDVPDVDMTDYYTKSEVDAKIANSGGSGSGGGSVTVDGKTILQGSNGIYTVVGGYLNESMISATGLNELISTSGYTKVIQGSWNFETAVTYTMRVVYSTGETEQGTFKFTSAFSTETNQAKACSIEGMPKLSTLTLMYNYTAESLNGLYLTAAISCSVAEIYIYKGAACVPINANFIPVDGTSITLNDAGQLCATGGSSTITYGTDDLTAGSTPLATGVLYCVYE